MDFCVRYGISAAGVGNPGFMLFLLHLQHKMNGLYFKNSVSISLIKLQWSEQINVSRLRLRERY
jgi:hypothetical protein